MAPYGLRPLLFFAVAAVTLHSTTYLFSSTPKLYSIPQSNYAIFTTRLKELTQETNAESRSPLISNGKSGDSSQTLGPSPPRTSIVRIKVKRLEATSPSSLVIITSGGVENSTIYDNTANDSILTIIGSTVQDEKTDSTRKALPKCPGKPPGLGPIADRAIDSADDIEAMFIEMVPGGIYKPRGCLARQSVAIIVPYINQANMFPLASFLYVLHPVLMKQQLDYRIFVTQAANKSDVFISRGMLMNVGFAVASAVRKDWGCFVFHNPLLLPTDSRNLYRCGQLPSQLVSAVSDFAFESGGYRAVTVSNRKSSLMKIAFGGVIAMRRKQFLNVNGFSNGFWTNDNDFEDMRLRMKVANYQYRKKIGVYAHYIRFINLNPTLAPYYYEKEPLVSTRRPHRYLQDGVATLPYHQQTIVMKHLYTHVIVDDSLPRKE